uniref:Uncharacterized protein n=1 Tax=Tanacetum cinerariifolium TaxID=118510 RepID=A0A6L2NSF4_TANCI|nr:hypothetical protein [Tanacetum cinerariifolium]
MRVPPAMLPSLSASIAEVEAMSDSVFQDDEEEDEEDEDEEVKESLDFDSDSEDVEDEGLAAEDEGFATGDEGVAEGDEGLGEPLGLGYGALRHKEIASREVQMPSVFEVGQGSRSIPDPERPEGVLALKHPALTTWIDLEDGKVYIDVPAYQPPAPHVQTSPSLKWSSGSLLVSPTPFIVPSPISSSMIPLTVSSPVASPDTAEDEGFLTKLGAQVEMQGGLIYDHMIRLGELSPALFERYDRDIEELFIRSGVVMDEIFSQRYRLRILKHEQKRVAVTFGAIWRPVKALESWIAEERCAQLDLAEIVDSMRRGQEPRGDV